MRKLAILISLSGIGVAANRFLRMRCRPKNSRSIAPRWWRKSGDAAAIVEGATEYPGYLKLFRQGNQFFYLTGVESPRAIVLIDGRTKTSTLYLQPRNERKEAGEGPVLVPGAEAQKLTGIERVADRDQFAGDLQKLSRDQRTLYLPFRADTQWAQTNADMTNYDTANANDPWDGRLSRAAVFRERVHVFAPRCAERDVDPILDELRTIKTPREIALIREATRLAGIAMTEAMAAAKPGMHGIMARSKRLEITRSNETTRSSLRISHWWRRVKIRFIRTIMRRRANLSRETWCCSITRRTICITAPT